MVFPDREQIVGVVDVRVTGNPEDAVAETLVAPPTVSEVMASNVIV